MLCFTFGYWIFWLTTLINLGKSTLFFQICKLDEELAKSTQQIVIGHIPHLYYNTAQLTAGVGKDILKNSQFSFPENEKNLEKVIRELEKSTNPVAFYDDMQPQTRDGKYTLFASLLQLWNDPMMRERVKLQKDSEYYFDGAT